MAVEKPNPSVLFKAICFKEKARHCFNASRQVAQDDMDDVVEEEEWLQQVDEVYDKLSVRHPIYYHSYNLCDLCQTQKLGSFNVEMLKSICSHFEICLKSRDRKHQLIKKLSAMIAECSSGKS